jgi:ABC-type lipoprotein export system ATPase subunit
VTSHLTLTCSNLSIQAGDRVLSSTIDLTVRPGELHAVMGSSGVGKSTLLWTIVGLMRPAAGQVTICDTRVNAARTGAAAAVRRRHTGIVYQQASLVQELSVLENVSVPLMMTRGIDLATANQRASALLDSFGLDPSAQTRHLSGGEQQRVSIARAVVGEPSLILADEPTAALDETTAAVVMDCLVTQCRRLGSALLMVTHDSRIAALADLTWQLTPAGLTQTGINPNGQP